MRILFVTGGYPWPTHAGITQRTNLLLRALRRCGTVDTVVNSPYLRISDEEAEYLRKTYGVVAHFLSRTPGDHWPWRLAARVSPGLADRLGVHGGGLRLWYKPQPDIVHWLGQRLREYSYDLIVGRYLRSLASSGALAYQPVLLDLDDYDCGVQRSRLHQPGLSALQRYSIRRQIRDVERTVPPLLRQCHHIWVTAREDQQLLSSFPTSILPNIPFEPEDTGAIEPCPPRPASTSILMVGSWAYQVNVRAVERFLATVWPQVRAGVPKSEFRIVGGGIVEDQKRRWGAVPGVVVVGFVQDLRGEYDRCAFTVSPIFEGGGTKIKVLESLRYGRTPVVASHSCRGYEDVLRHGEAVWMAPDEKALAEGCLRLLKEALLRDKMADQGHRLVCEHWSYERFQQVVSEAVAQVAREGKGVRTRRVTREDLAFSSSLSMDDGAGAGNCRTIDPGLR